MSGFHLRSNQTLTDSLRARLQAAADHGQESCPACGGTGRVAGTVPSGRPLVSPACAAALRRRFGVHGEVIATHRDIGAALGITTSAVQYRVQEGLSRLCSALMRVHEGGPVPAELVSWAFLVPTVIAGEEWLFSVDPEWHNEQHLEAFLALCGRAIRVQACGLDTGAQVWVEVQRAYRETLCRLGREAAHDAQLEADAAAAEPPVELHEWWLLPERTGGSAPVGEQPAGEGKAALVGPDRCRLHQLLKAAVAGV